MSKRVSFDAQVRSALHGLAAGVVEELEDLSGRSEFVTQLVYVSCSLVVQSEMGQKVGEAPAAHGSSINGFRISVPQQLKENFY